MKVAFNGRGGKVGLVLAPALEAAGHDLVELHDADAVVDFTAPETVVENVRAALERGSPASSGRRAGNRPGCQSSPRRRAWRSSTRRTSQSAQLEMRFATEAARHLSRAEIIEPTERRRRTHLPACQGNGERMGGAAIHSVRLPGLVAHQEVLFGGDGQLLTIRHDANPRGPRAGVLLALEKLPSLPPGLTVGLEELLGWSSTRQAALLRRPRRGA